MRTNLSKTITGAILAAMAICQLAPAASAQAYYYANPYYRPGVFTTHPILSSTLVGGAVGALGGVAVGAYQQHQDHSGAVSVGKDTAIGAGAGAAVGAGVGMIKNKAMYGYWL